MYLLRAKQAGFTLADLECLEEGMVVDVCTEMANDTHADQYKQLATQADFDKFRKG